MMYKNNLIGNQKVKHVTWSESYSLGIRQIDDQHKELLLFVNELFNNSAEGEIMDGAYFRGVIQQMVHYIKNHFSTEEKYMLAMNYPGFAAHKKVHDEFILTIIKTAKDYDAGKRLMPEKLAYFLKDWVLSHVAVMDLQYAHHYRKLIATRQCL